jgi:hypothetical protein
MSYNNSNNIGNNFNSPSSSDHNNTLFGIDTSITTAAVASSLNINNNMNNSDLLSNQNTTTTALSTSLLITGTDNKSYYLNNENVAKYLESTTSNMIVLQIKEKISSLLQVSYILQCSSLDEVDLMVDVETRAASSSSSSSSSSIDQLDAEDGAVDENEEEKKRLDSVLSWFSTVDDDDNEGNSNINHGDVDRNQLGSTWKLSPREMYAIATLRTDFKPKDWIALHNRLVQYYCNNGR